MLDKRILATLTFFDLQQCPLTLLEVHRFLLTDVSQMQNWLDDQYELENLPQAEIPSIKLDEVMEGLNQLVLRRQLGVRQGFYHLPGRGNLVTGRLHGYIHGFPRERRVWRFVPMLRFIPFVRGVALGGSQAMGVQKKESDIDLFIITHKQFLWLTRFLVTAVFQIFGVRRYKHYITDRFCLNHYLSRVRQVNEHRNLYSAMEYARLRPLVHPGVIHAFQLANADWINLLFPHSIEVPDSIEKFKPLRLQRMLEQFIQLLFGRPVEAWLKKHLLPRIKPEKFIVVKDDELSLHPHSKQEWLLPAFFEAQHPEQGETVELVV